MNSAFLPGLIAAFCLTGCSGQFDSGQALAQSISDAGDLSIEYVPPQNPDYQELATIIENAAVYEQMVEKLNQELALPTDILVKFEECGEENAYYDSENAQISMCYELIQRYAEIFGEETETEAEYENEVVYAGLFTFFHEVGHALVDQYQLPIVGREEDVVDSFAAVWLVEAGEADAAIAGVNQFNLDAAEEAELEELSFADEHSLSVQRFYNVACILYGSDPESYSDWVDADWLPSERADQCEAEYAQASASWEKLLAPYRKPQ